MNSIRKLLNVGDYVYSAAGGEPMKVTHVGLFGFQTEVHGYFDYDEVRKLYFLTEAGYKGAKGRREKNGQLQDHKEVP